MEEYENIINLKNMAGEDIPFNYLGSVIYRGNEYLILLPVDVPDGEEGFVKVFFIESYNEESDEETYLEVTNPDQLTVVFKLFKDKYRGEYVFDG